MQHIRSGSLLLLRPTLMKRVRNAPGYRSSTAKMVGATGVATAQITRDGGEIKVDGQTWSARAYDRTQVIEKGTEIEVYGNPAGLPPDLLDRLERELREMEMQKERPAISRPPAWCN